MPDKIIIRVEQIIDHYSLSLRGFDKRLGLGQNYIGKMIKSQGNIGADVVQKIVCEFPEISMEWWIKGEGEMFKPEASVVNEPKTDYYKEKIDRFEEMLLYYLDRPRIKEKIKAMSNEKK